MKEEKTDVPKKKKKSKKYKGPKYNNGLVLGNKTFRPAEVPEDGIESFLEENPIMTNYFK